MSQSTEIICRCEEISLQQLVDTAVQYQCSSRELKLRTRAGMGYCGGRTCRVLVDQIAQLASGREMPADLPLRVQPPVRPIPFHTTQGGDAD